MKQQEVREFKPGDAVYWRTVVDFGGRQTSFKSPAVWGSKKATIKHVKYRFVGKNAKKVPYVYTIETENRSVLDVPADKGLILPRG